MLSEYTAVMKAVGDRTRVRVLKMLERGELCVCQIMAVLEMSSSTVSKHLSILRQAGLVRNRKDGRWVYYALDQSGRKPYARTMLRHLVGWLENDEQIAADRERLTRVTSVPIEEICLSDGRAVIPETATALDNADAVRSVRRPGS